MDYCSFQENEIAHPEMILIAETNSIVTSSTLTPIQLITADVQLTGVITAPNALSNQWINNIFQYAFEI